MRLDHISFSQRKVHTSVCSRGKKKLPFAGYSVVPPTPCGASARQASSLLRRSREAAQASSLQHSLGRSDFAAPRLRRDKPRSICGRSHAEAPPGAKAEPQATQFNRCLLPSGSRTFPGGHRRGVTPVPIPNTAVKPSTADGTARVTAWESRSLPGLFLPKGRCQTQRPFSLYATVEQQIVGPPAVDGGFQR